MKTRFGIIDGFDGQFPKPNTEWMPENPFPLQNDDVDTFQYNRNKAWRLGVIAGQKKLLEYQLAKAKAMKVGTVRTELGLWIESMLQQLEEK
jgi:hypothetical protein